jgi:hypothetical protein
MILLAIGPPLIAAVYFGAPALLQAFQAQALHRQPRPANVDQEFVQAIDSSAREFLQTMHRIGAAPAPAAPEDETRISAL